MSHRPLAIVTGLAIGDYLLWNWSLNANHGVLALVSGLTLPPLIIALLSLVVLTTARLIARSSRARASAAQRAAASAGASRPATTQSPSPTSASSSRKIAA